MRDVPLSIVPIHIYGLEPGKVYLIEVKAADFTEYSTQALRAWLEREEVRAIIVRSSSGQGLRIIPHDPTTSAR